MFSSGQKPTWRTGSSILCLYIKAPDNFKNKIKECFGLRCEGLLRRAEAICNFEEQSIFQNAKMLHTNLSVLSTTRDTSTNKNDMRTFPHIKEHLGNYEQNRWGTSGKVIISAHITTKTDVLRYGNNIVNKTNSHFKHD